MLNIKKPCELVNLLFFISEVFIVKFRKTLNISEKISFNIFCYSYFNPYFCKTDVYNKVLGWQQPVFYSKAVMKTFQPYRRIILQWHYFEIWKIVSLFVYFCPEYFQHLQKRRIHKLLLISECIHLSNKFNIFCRLIDQKAQCSFWLFSTFCILYKYYQFSFWR